MRLYKVSVQAEVLVWAQNEHRAQEAAETKFHRDMAVLGEDVLEAWAIPFGPLTWYTDGYAAFPWLIPGWVRVDRDKPYTLDVLGGRVEAMRRGEIPKIAYGGPISHHGVRAYLIGDGLRLAARYVDPLDGLPGVRWHHDGTKRGALATTSSGRLVALVAPMLGGSGVGD